jgi:hypothetical protein
VTETSGSTQLPEGYGFGVYGFRWWPATFSWMVVCFLIAFALAAIVVAIFGAGIHGTGLVLRWTGRWSFLLFWLAYAGTAMAALFGRRFAGLARRGRELGLGFASAQLVHVGFVLWLYYIAPEPVGRMVVFWAGVFCTYALALFSLPQLRAGLGPRVWQISRTIGLEYIALVFAFDFIFLPLHGGYDKYPPSDFPLAVMLVSGASMRFAALVRRIAEGSDKRQPLGSDVT